VRRKRNAQAIVEFGIIALLFTLILFAVIDIGLLLNTWLSVSSSTREVARSASVGKQQTFLVDQTKKIIVPSVSASGFTGGACCASDSALELRVEYFPCVPGPSCTAPFDGSQIDNRYPAPDGNSGTCTPGPTCRPLPDDSVRVTIVAHGAQVITPLVRPFFSCMDGSVPRCYVALSSTTTMRYEGQEF
jgi:TadE-like protein